MQTLHYNARKLNYEQIPNVYMYLFNKIRRLSP